MLRKSFFALGGAFLALTVLIGCTSAAAGADKVSLGKEFTLPVGQSVQISGEDLTLKFQTVTTDSRSPTGAETIWAGEAKSQMQVTYKGTTSTIVLTEQGGLTEGYSESTFERFKIQHRLQPYPEVGKQPSADEYELVLIISK